MTCRKLASGMAAAALLGNLLAAVLMAQGGTVQRVYPTPERQTRPASSAVAVDVFFTTDNNVAAFTGLGLRAHWDSRKLAFQPPTNLLNTGFEAQMDPQIDSEDLDADPATDRFILIAWFDNGSKWPGQVPIRLLTLNFSTLASFTGTTSIRFSASSVFTGYEFHTTPALVDSGSGPTITTTTTSSTRISTSTSTTTATTTTTSTTTTLPQRNRCDLNGDGLINILDIQQAVNCYLRGTCSADINCDGRTDVLDIQTLVNIYLNAVPCPACGQQLRTLSSSNR